MPITTLHPPIEGDVVRIEPIEGREALLAIDALNGNRAIITAVSDGLFSASFAGVVFPGCERRPLRDILWSLNVTAQALAVRAGTIAPDAVPAAMRWTVLDLLADMIRDREAFIAAIEASGETHPRLIDRWRAVTDAYRAIQDTLAHVALPETLTATAQPSPMR